MAGLGALLGGAIAGVITSLAWPARILPGGPVRGLSLLLSPLLSGLLMDRYGDWREERTGSRTFLATFWGGASFAFGMALARFLWVGD